ncbi:MAG: SPOR domain-containing protein [Gammaproteobacteria bacterium]|nr:SPOR domain-containing protein [Gammaproteobacteria bacterium]
MRSFFFLLLLTNLAFLGWQYLQVSPEGGELHRQSGVVSDQGLALLTELPPAQRPALREGVEERLESAAPITQRAVAKPTSAADSGGPADKRYCARVEGITEAAEAKRLLEQLKQVGAVSLVQGSEQTPGATNYWVILSPYPSSEKAAEAAAMLKQRRISDFFIVRSGEYENAVSLGVFSSRERAEARAKEIRGLKAGLRRPVITSRERSVESYWLRYELREIAQQQALEAIVADHAGASVKEITCK